MRIRLLLLVLAVGGCGGGELTPTFVVKSPQRPAECLAFYVPREMLREHGITATEYEKVLRSMFTEMRQTVTDLSESVVSDLGPTAEELEAKQRASYQRQDAMLKSFRLSRESLQNLLDCTRAEIWAVNSDGTHTIQQSFSSLRPLSADILVSGVW